MAINQKAFVAVASVVGLLAGAAGAQTVVLTANLQGSQEVPPVTTNAGGSATMTINKLSGAFSLDITFSDLSSFLTMGHFHRAPAGSNGPVVYWLSGTNANGTVERIPSTMTSQNILSFTGTLNGTVGGGWAEDLYGGRVYINLHSQNFPGGELRGQLVPGASTAGALALAGLAAARRRRA